MRAEEAYELDRQYYESKMKEINKNENQKTICEWAKDVFGTQGSDIELLKKKLKEECNEFFEELSSDKTTKKQCLTECADIYIVLVQLVDALGGNLQDEVDTKMTVNRARKWRFINGVFKHKY